MYPIGDPQTWKTAIAAEKIEKDDVQGVANNVVRHVTTTLARQANNLDEVRSWVEDILTCSLRLTSPLLCRSATNSSSELWNAN